MFSNICAKKNSNVIAMSYPFPKNQMRREAKSEGCEVKSKGQRRLGFLRTLKRLTFFL